MNVQLYHLNVLTLFTFRYLHVLVIEPVFRSSRRSARGRRPVRLPAEEAGQGSEVLRLRGLSDGQAGRPHGQRWAVNSFSSINSGLHVNFPGPIPVLTQPTGEEHPTPDSVPARKSSIIQGEKKLSTLNFQELGTSLE